MNDDNWHLAKTISGEGEDDYSGWSVPLSGNGVVQYSQVIFGISPHIIEHLLTNTNLIHSD